MSRSARAHAAEEARLTAGVKTPRLAAGYFLSVAAPAWTLPLLSGALT